MLVVVVGVMLERVGMDGTVVVRVRVLVLGRLIVLVLMVVIAVTVLVAVDHTVGVRMWVLMFLGHGRLLR